MVEISKFAYSFSPDEDYIHQLCNLSQQEQSNIINVMLTERFIGQYRFNFRDDQTIVFAGKTYDPYGQPIIDCHFVLKGYHHFLPRQIITGNSLLSDMECFDIYQDQ